MSIRLSEFWTRLVREGILDAPACRSTAENFASTHGGSPPTDAAELAKFLVSNDTLTGFQAQSLVADPQVDLRLGSYRLRATSSTTPLTRWVEVESVAASQNRGVLIRTTPGNPWLDAHAAVAGETLQPIHIEPLGEYVGVFSELPAGESLDTRIERTSSAWDPKAVCDLGIAMADALAAMHAASVIHGSVRADRVWISQDGRKILLRDPAGPPVAGLGDVSSQWLDTTSDPSAYVAPELMSGDRQTSQCTGASDIYSLGCLLFRLASGRHAFASDSVTRTLAAHRSDSPPELVAALESGEAGDPVYRVLAYTMAKDPAARFASAEQLAAALRAVREILPKQVIDPAATKSPAPAKPVAVAPTTVKPARTKPDTAPKPSNSPSKSSSKSVSVEKRASEEPSKAPLKPNKESKRKPKRDPVVADVPSSLPARPTEPVAADPIDSPVELPTPKAPDTKVPDAKVPSGNEPPKKEPPPAQPIAKADQVSASTLVAEAPADSSSSVSLRRRRRKKSKAPLVLTALTVVVLAQFITLLVTDPTTAVVEKRKRPPIPAVIPSVSSRPKSTVDERTSENADAASPAANSTADDANYALVDDDRLLFAPPYAPSSANAPLELLPPGPAAVVSVRMQSLLDSPAGQSILDALSPELTGLVDSAAAGAGVPLSWIRRCTVGLYRGKDGRPDVSLAIELDEARSLDELVQRWRVDASQTRDGATVFAGETADGPAFFIRPDEIENQSVTRYAVGSLPRITEVASIDGETIPLARVMGTLWNGTSVDADVVALLTPNFLFADGRTLLTETAPELVTRMRSVLIPNVSGVLVTIDLPSSESDSMVFGEFRLTPSGGISEAKLMRDLRDAINGWPAWADQFVIEAVPDPSWRLLASRLPTMMRFVSDRFRYGISDNMIVANTYLPAPAISQVSLATLLAANTPLGNAAALLGNAPAAPLSIDEMLNRKMSVSFDQESLEFAIDVIVGEFTRELPDGSTLPPVKIVGGDLQKMGITQNQQIRGFAKTDIPLRTVLTDLVVGANPDKTAVGPADPKQALIWVVADDADNPGSKVILVTTREAAKNKYELPTEFGSTESSD
ncbi:Serine/threonine-protein kinase PknH [Rubripirellula tenax]|uniref:non-specific serine/threonine protein kinase n=1 Tax=Rubripirellula tenax TaxID=2528015 RepID=A0A5C6F8C6_9BACT|nr:protein kinase [Rubripirellula tenax]TWU56744.1 Serine/threonine-protein kinase PknH [Rubripirellula tenax]